MLARGFTRLRYVVGDVKAGLDSVIKRPPTL